MACVDIQIEGNRQHYSVGDKVAGLVEVTLPVDTPLGNITVSFHCVGKVKWCEFPGTKFYHCGQVYKHKCEYYEAKLDLPPDEIEVQKNIGDKKARIPFWFLLPDNQNLPSSLFCSEGFVKYIVQVGVKQKEQIKLWEREVFVQSPLRKHLMISVGGKAEKHLPIHGGHLSMHASIGRKGFFAGETVTVHIVVDNQTNVRVKPRISLQQLQINMCASRHRILNTTLNEQPVVGSEISSHSITEQVLSVQIPLDLWLSMKSSVITIKYFVHVTLSITLAIDFHVDLPIVVTTQKAINQTKNENLMHGLVNSVS